MKHHKALIIITLLSCMISIAAFSNTVADSTDVIRLNLLAKRALTQYKPDSALVYALHAAEVARNLTLTQPQAYSLIIAAQASRMQQQTGTALKYYLQGKKLLEQLPESVMLGDLYQQMGGLYEYWGLDKKAQEYYLSAYAIFQRNNTEENIDVLLRKIGEVYYKLENYEDALTYFQQLYLYYRDRKQEAAMRSILKNMATISQEATKYARAIEYQEQLYEKSKQTGDTLEMMNAFYQMASVYHDAHQYNKALEHFQKYLNLTAPISSPQRAQSMIYQYIEAMTSIGHIYEEWGEVEEDEEYLNNALAYYGVVLNVIESLKLKDPRYFKRMARTYLHVARTYMKLSDYRNAVFYSHKSLENMRSHKDLEVLSETYEVLVYSLRKMRKFRSALRYYDKLIQTHDSLAAEELKERKQKIMQQAHDNQQQFIINKTEQDIVDQELDSLTIRQLELEAKRREQELALLRTDRELQAFAIKNEQLQKDKAMQELLLIQQQLSVEKQQREISELQQNQLIQTMELRQQTLEQQEKERVIQLLEKNGKIKALELKQATASKSYYIIGMVLISIILVLIFINLLSTRKANRKLAFQNAKIEQQAQNLKQANASIVKQNALIEEKNRALIQLNKEKNHIIGIIAHDLRNPLAVSMSLTDFIEQQPGKLTVEQQEGLRIMNRSMHRMNEMITKILDLRAIESNRLNITLESVNFSEVIQQVVNDFIDLAAGKKIALFSEIASEHVEGIADAQYLRQVLENLVSNAIKFSPKGKHIRVVLQSVGQQIMVGVADEGPGLTMEDQQKLFGKFQKLSAKPTGGEQSTGLGLSIVKKYVELMHGEVWCESQPKQGATFWVSFPISANVALQNA